jgi:uncharacterized protein
MSTPSRYNLRATTDDGRLILWNTLTSSLSVFGPDQRPAVWRLFRGEEVTGRSAVLEGYLRDRGFLVPDGTEDLRRVELLHGRTQERSDVLELILMASEDCNFRCVYCYEKFERGTMRPEVREGVKNLLRKRLPTLTALSVSWFGGEPLYGMRAIEDLAPFFQTLSAEHGLKLANHMTTNGYLLTDEVTEKLLSWGIRDFQITLDGLAPDHDARRPGRHGEPTFDVILGNLVGLHRRSDPFSARIRVNFDRENAARLDGLLDLLREDLGGDARFCVAFHAVGRWGGTRDGRLRTCDRLEARQVRNRLGKAAHARGLTVAGSLQEINSPGSQVCYAAKPYSFVVGADGRLLKCTVALDRLDLNRVGRLHEDGELTLDEDRLALWTQPFFEHDETCRRCVLLPICQGSHCPLSRLESETRSCPEIRTTFKADLRESLATVPARRHRLLAAER